MLCRKKSQNEKAAFLWINTLSLEDPRELVNHPVFSRDFYICFKKMAITDLSHSSTCMARCGSFLTAFSQNASLAPIVLSHAFQGYCFRLFLFPNLLSFNDIIYFPAYSAPNGHLLLSITHRDMDVGQAPQTHHGQNGIHCLPHHT